MKGLLLTLITALSFPSFGAVELKDVFPLTCAVEYDGDPATLKTDEALPQTFHDLDEIDTLGGAPFWWHNPDSDWDGKYVFGFIAGKFRAQFRRYETDAEKSVRVAAAGGKDDEKTIHIVDTDTKYASLDELASGEPFRFWSPETPKFVLVCKKGLSF